MITIISISKWIIIAMSVMFVICGFSASITEPIKKDSSFFDAVLALFAIVSLTICVCGWIAGYEVF